MIINKCYNKMKDLDQIYDKGKNNEFQEAVDFLVKKLSAKSLKTLSALLDSWGKGNE